MKILLLLLTVVPTIFSNSLPLHAERNHQISRTTISHSKALFANTHQKRHQLTSNQHNLWQVTPLDVGNHMGFSLKLIVDGLEYWLSMDTGSADIFVKGQNTTGLPEKKYKNNEDYSKLEKIGLGYLDGSVMCYNKILPVNFNDLDIDMSILVAYEADENFDDQGGIVGLSYPFLAVHRPTFIESLIQEKIIDNYAYGMNLNLIEQNRSFVTFGQNDPAFYQGQLHEYKILSQNFVKIQMNSMFIGQSGIMKMSTALLDTGNTCISIPAHFKDQILVAFNKGKNKCEFWLQENVPKFSLLICRISDFKQMPDLNIVIGDQKYTIQKQFYLQKCTQNPEDYGKGPKYCETYIQIATGEQMLFLGDGFFNRFYTYFDLDKNVVGIAPNKEEITMQKIYKLKSTWDPLDWEIVRETKEEKQQAKKAELEKQPWYQKIFSGIFGS